MLLTDVEIGRVTALSYLFFKLQSDTDLEPVASVTGGTPPSQLTRPGQPRDVPGRGDAKTAALRRLGYTVTATPAGAVIFGTFPGTPAYAVLHVGDVVTAVDGTPTPTARALTTAAGPLPLGADASPSPCAGGARRRRCRCRHPEDAPRSTSAAARRTTVDLGIEPEDQVDFTYPFPVNIDVTNIGGPSAGLAMTLGVIDALTSGSVTGGHTVAATGTIDSQGNVGDVGGVAQKTVAVENAGATIFLVPPQEYKAALSKDRPGLKVYAVSTLDQALAVLAAHGGTVPPAPASPLRRAPRHDRGMTALRGRAVVGSRPCPRND